MLNEMRISWNKIVFLFVVAMAPVWILITGSDATEASTGTLTIAADTTLTKDHADS